MSLPSFRSLGLVGCSAFVVSQAVPGMLTLLMPAYINLLTTEGAMSASNAGLLGTLELIASAIAAVTVGVRGIVVRKAVLYGGILAVLGNVISLVATSEIALFGARILVGGSLGVSLAGSSALFARLSDPERASAIAIAVTTAAAALLMATLPVLSSLGDNGGAWTIYALMTALAASLSVSAFALPPHDSRRSDRASSDDSGPPATLGLTSIMLVAAYLLFIVSDASLYSVGALLGIRASLDEGLVLQLLGLFLLVGIVAAPLAPLVSKQVPVRTAIGVVGFAKAIATLGLAFVSGALGFVTTQVMIAVAAFIVQPWFVALAVRQDRSGRTNSMLAFAYGAGTAVGPWLGGSMWDLSGPTMLLVCSACGTIGSVFVISIFKKR